ncbi:malonyl-CoA synthase [Rhodobacteraceae bacterium LMO-12]|nr:malonyl-CoA synthase [Rhodobacteraceae bacterium LMO-JJ12]
MTNHLYDALFAHHVGNSRCFLMLNAAGTDPQDISFDAFVSRAGQLATVLIDNGVCPGDRVVVQAPKSAEMLALYAATLQVGAVFLPLNTGYTKDELTYFITDSTPRLLVCEGEKQDALRPVSKAAGASLLTLNKDGTGTLCDAMNAAAVLEKVTPRGPDDLAALLYTSGTTGRSKGAMLTHDNLLSNARALTKAWEITDHDTLIHALPIFHTHGLFVAMNTALLAGVRVNFMDTFDLDAILDAMPSSTLMMGVPTFYTRLLASDRLTKTQAAHMRLFISGSAPLLAETHEAFTARTGHYILERYGMTETNMSTSNPYDGARKPGTVGTPLPGVEVRLSDATGATLSQGEVGMIEIRGPNVFKGYWNMPEKTAEEIRDNGFFITGDLGQFDADGYLSIVGRQKDLIITGGYNVYPKEIEDVINDIEGVVESAVVGVPHADFGEMIIAAVVLDTHHHVTEADIKAKVESKLARFKHPRSYRMLEGLPRNTMGKVQKNVLRDSFTSHD